MKLLVLAPLLLLLCQCGNPPPPRCHTVPKSSLIPAPKLLREARLAWTQMNRKRSPAALSDYNEALSKLFDQLRCGRGDWEQKASKLDTSLPQLRDLGMGLTLKDLDALVPSSQISLEDVGPRQRDPGMGLPLVGWKSIPEFSERVSDFAPPTGIPLNLTTFLDFSTTPPTWRFANGEKSPRVQLARRSERLAVDWSAPGALYWAMSDLDDFDLTKVFLPTRFTNHTGLFFASPYSPDKIPVVFVHGLNSSPGTYKKLHNHLVGQKWFRDHYQALFFSYPTGIAWPYNAAKFRRLLRKARDFAATRGPLENWNDMVIVSHSMGGVITRASLVDPAERFYEASYHRPLEKLRVSPSTREAIANVRLYDPLESPSRVIFMATPHRGAPLADRRLFHWISSLVRLPKTITIDFATATLDEIARALQQGGEARPPLTSFGTLTPGYEPYAALNASPFRPGLTYHSIIGDRGKNTGAKSSDGIVPYWSSHLEGAQSEKIVPEGHSLTSAPTVITEVCRILKRHLRKNGKG